MNTYSYQYQYNMSINYNQRKSRTLTCDCSLITHHTISADLSGGSFLKNKERILASLQRVIDTADMDRLSAVRNRKRTL